MLTKLKTLVNRIGNTPLIQLEHEKINLFAKLELHNFMSSVKIRPAYYILKTAIESGEINQNTTVIESSSGNFGVALATLCKYLHIKFIAVIDPNINSNYEQMLRSIAYDVVKVTTPDPTGGYLLTRVKTVQELCQQIPYSFWTNQYENPNNPLSHYLGLGAELVGHFGHLDYAFIGVSSGGTISGISQCLKESFPHVKIIAVDSEGSVIFGDKPKKRYIPGLGSSMVPPNVKRALIDEIIHVSEINTVEGCKQLFEEHAIFAGGSSGTSYYAINQYFEKMKPGEKPNVVFICPDSGVPYINTIYNQDWKMWLYEQNEEQARLSVPNK
ncbi:2,3-diaminopropionate biosynthesis protein SbnA [Paenibacillus larvae]|uniref:2,3-diaminopropionate biosynthesis protein SbnA n=1 Tax=Paenibacillus larvae TaxID=1464 RepID=UPI00227FFF0D|nr:2,3-diaminopropionate biosynthesis protein SbnA [Paenibacillus larvae]MCY9508504.1 2,3-diaminopropionate biosynthesis protein SbnA [Paenibacillus larvae]MCY9527068.1 2,3-diaminopropionate biosynthesis protein SbnA [Paenibacillus larvae]